MKSTISLDSHKQTIVGCKQRRGLTNDCLDFPIVIKNTFKAIHTSIYITDKGYDSEKNHKLIRDNVGAYSIKPPRNKAYPSYKR